ncbi:MAG: hypothetical protein COA33_006950 [Fluviicola sp.]|nr:hypothetical protein [Fluviicola sp.]
MKFILPFLAFLLIFSSCKKEDINSAGSSTQLGYFQSQPGTYWIYEWYSIDSNNVESSLGIVDSVFISGDTIIDGEIYAVYNGGFHGNLSPESYKRDSSGYIVEPSGNILYSYVSFSDTLNTYSEPGFWDTYSYMTKTPNITTVPAGVFSTIKYETLYYDPAGGAINNCGDLTFVMGSSYSSTVGEVKTRTGYFGEIQTLCKFRERRLTSYYIP